ncbi:MAG: hypothetical protein OEV79_11445 [candidate division WOR-3 bacterium]|nr:hypothetical protein [candidate division WOR-3 bacterium]
MRFAWQKKKSSNDVPTTKEPTSTYRLIMVAYNIVWWIPIVLPVIGVIDYRTGFSTFLAVTVVRVAANLFRNNVLKPEHAEHFPLRSP